MDASESAVLAVESAMAFVGAGIRRQQASGQPTMRRGRASALHALAALLLGAPAAVATADDASCCLDLEQRIAELEAAGVQRIMLQDFLPRDLDHVRTMGRLIA